MGNRPASVWGMRRVSGWAAFRESWTQLAPKPSEREGAWKEKVVGGVVGTGAGFLLTGFDAIKSAIAGAIGIGSWPIILGVRRLWRAWSSREAAHLRLLDAQVQRLVDELASAHAADSRDRDASIAQDIRSRDVEIAALKGALAEKEQMETARTYYATFGAPVITNWSDSDSESAKEIRKALFALQIPARDAHERIQALLDELFREWIGQTGRAESLLPAAWRPFRERLSRCHAAFDNAISNKEDARQPFFAFVLNYRTLRDRIQSARKLCELARTWPYWERDDAEFEKELQEASSEVESFQEIQNAFACPAAIEVRYRT